ncbi:MAG: D-glucuronyl C5-epimerase family protein, partial [Solirubrobacteraceae bacterium]
MRLRLRFIAALAVSLLALSITAIARTGGSEPAPRPVAPGGLPVATDAPDRDDAAQPRRDREAERAAQLSRLRRSGTIRAALRRLALLHLISTSEHRRLRRTLWTAQRAHSRLRGTRRAELGAVIATAQRLAPSHTLTASRIEPIFLTLRRNRDFWTQRALPRAGRRVTFGRDPVVFEYYPGRGLALQPLAGFGRASAMASLCLAAHTRYRCRPHALRRLLERMLSLAADRGDFRAWEYYFSFAGGRVPWISAMTQATAAQALSRAARALDEPRYEQAALGALGALEARPPVGVGLRSGAGSHYVMYSFDPRLRILNGELQALIGLREAALLTGSARATRLYQRAEPATRRSVRAFDTGAWSLYSNRGEESTLGYHRLVGTFLGVLCRRTGRPQYCVTQRRFKRYERQPPRVRLRATPPIRRGRPARIRFSLSKLSRVRVVVWGRHGVQLRREAQFAHGTHTLRWTPPRGGAVRV